MRVILSLFTFALLCVSFAPAPAEARVAVVASGGGIRATFGTILALDAMKKKGITNEINKFYGLSGGAWGVSWFQNNKGDTSSIISSIRGREKGWGDMSEFSPVACGEKTGFFYDSCHRGWIKSIEKDVFLNPQSLDLDTGFGSGRKKKEIAFLLDICSKKKKSILGKFMEHTHQCSYENKELNCVKFSDPTDSKTYDVSSAEIKEKKNKWHKNTPYDWLGFSSSAWAEVGDRTNGVFEKTPSDVKIKDTEGTEHTMKFCDSGAICNLPLGLFITRESEFLGGRIHRVVMLDYSAGKDGEPLADLFGCLTKHWKNRFGWDLPGTCALIICICFLFVLISLAFLFSYLLDSMSFSNLLTFDSLPPLRRELLQEDGLGIPFHHAPRQKGRNQG